MRPRAIALRAASICEVVGYACRCRLFRYCFRYCRKSRNRTTPKIRHSAIWASGAVAAGAGGSATGGGGV